MKNPNGYGSVVKLSGKRRKPWGVRLTLGFNAKGHPIYKFLGYFSSQKQANLALAEYNKSPYDLDAARVKFSEIYEKWLIYHEKSASQKLSPGTLSTLKSAYKHCEYVINMRYFEIKKRHMQACIDDCGHGYSTQAAIKSLFRHLDKFALENEIITVCQSATLTSEPIQESHKKPFTIEEIASLWAIKNEPFVDGVLIFLYTGFRISELLDVKISDIDLEKNVIIGGKKTRAGKNRQVPIHPKISDFIAYRLKICNNYLLEQNGKKLTKNSYYKIWYKIMKMLNFEHTPHECRHTFRSALDDAGANKKCIDLIMGHASADVGERVYTHKTLEQLQETIGLIGY